MFETLVLGSRQEFAFRSDTVKLGEDSSVGDQTESESCESTEVTL